jgi:hypothetical protein
MAFVSVPFDNKQLMRLTRLLDSDPGQAPDADAILEALENALKVRKAADKSLSLSRSSREQIRGNPLLEDARRRAVDAAMKKS